MEADDPVTTFDGNYAAMMSGIDDWIGDIIDLVRHRGELDNTLIIFASDHGEMLGDYGLWNKSVAYEASVRVPLVLAGPGIERGKTSDRLVELIDVAPALLEYAGIEPPEDWDARSLSRKPRTWQHNALRERNNNGRRWEMACDERWKLIRHDDGRTELFDLQNDPRDLENLAQNQPHECNRLAALLESVRR